MPPLDLLDVAPATLDDDALRGRLSALAELRRRVDVAVAAVSAEIAHRSRPEHGLQGLAQRSGLRTPERLVQQLSGLDAREARSLVQVGVLLTADAAPWLAAVGSALEEGRVTIAKADAIRAGLGSPTAEVAADDLTDAAEHLTRLAPTLTVERLAARAREVRDHLDVAGVADRERMLREKRYLNLTPTGDGMTRITGLLDPRSAAIVGAAYDAATSPRRGGVRFVDAEARAAADAIVADPRTTGQIALDTLVDLIRIGSAADPGKLLGGNRHAVRVLVTAHDLATPDGVGFIDGQSEAISRATVDEHICEAGIVPIQFDVTARDPLQLGRTRRLFSSRQREVLVARDGGCRFPECDRPPSWTETHHSTPWSHGGPTDTRDGVLLCSHHHHLVHDNGWIIRPDDEHGFVAIPPPDVDPRRTPIPMPSRSRALARLADTVSAARP
jgi:hypothetical protein